MTEPSKRDKSSRRVLAVAQSSNHVVTTLIFDGMWFWLQQGFGAKWLQDTRDWDFDDAPEIWLNRADLLAWINTNRAQIADQEYGLIREAMELPNSHTYGYGY